jgi:hypothetical protein
VVEGPHVGNRRLCTHLYWSLMVDKNGDRAGPFRGISGTLRREGQEECYGYSEISMWQHSPVLVKDGGISTREQVLNVSIACW